MRILITGANRGLGHHVIFVVRRGSAHDHDGRVLHVLGDAVLHELQHLAVVAGDEPRRAHQVRLTQATSRHRFVVGLATD